MTPGYPAARAAAVRIHPQFARHEGASVPEIPDIEAIIDAAFWASLRREEGFLPKISLAFAKPDQVEYPLLFERRLPLAPYALTRLAPAVERPGIHLGVSREGAELSVWGATRNLPAFCFVLEVVAPGLLVVKHNRSDDSGKFVNVAVLQGDDIKVVDQIAATMPDHDDMQASLRGFDSDLPGTDPMNIVIQLAVSMRAHGRGGSLLVVPADSAWQESVRQPVTYSVAPAFSVLADLMQKNPEERPQRRWQDALRRAVDAIAGLTAVDGAGVITNQYELLAFGVKIIRRKGSAPIDKVLLTEPIENVRPDVVDLGQLGGTRHLSAAQFAQDQQDAIALVASQDGRFTVFAWSPSRQMVQAHRIEALLL